MKQLWIVFLTLLAVGVPTNSRAAENLRQFGFAKVDITPKVALRLSGYGSRAKPSDGVAEPLYARVAAFKDVGGKVSLLVAVDSIGFPGELTKSLHAKVEKMHDIPRSRFVICCSHSHATPQIDGGLTNLFAVPMTEEQTRNVRNYTTRISRDILVAVDRAIKDLEPGRMYFASGTVRFAQNRRVLKDGVWTGFGVNPDGPVDHDLPLLKITDASGKSVRGILFNYACHCTTFGGGYNQINGDWAGYASEFIEAEQDGAITLCCIGCGGDANPPRKAERAVEMARAAGREIADEVDRLLSNNATEVEAPLSATFGYAGLPIQRPSLDSLRESLKNRRPQIRQHAENMLALHKRMGRLPETYPMPIQIWRFGDQFAMVFLGGEVVVDYALRIKRELKARGVWVSAYANDVFGYVSSERMQSEGGYEVDYSMIYYNQPGRWKPGTEDVVLRRVHELYNATDEESPQSPDKALQSFRLSDDFEVTIVAAEPLIRDPVNFHVGPDGRLWVVEMSDYPRGEKRGRVRVLKDVDHDGDYDHATTFLDDLSFPSGVMPWSNGALIAASPDILFAEDRDGDGKADHQEILWTGFEEANPQHRLAGFAYGLDNWLYLSGGTRQGEVTHAIDGVKVNVAKRDIRIHPDTGRLQPLSGQSQFGRCRDDWGNWFGNTNSEPLFHFAIEDRHLARNPFVASPSPRVPLTSPARAPEVFPASRTVDRFNDLFAANRFTSACSPHVFRDTSLGADIGAAAFICEPVHNLVSRVMLEDNGVTFRGLRHASELDSEFLASTDGWFRPVCVKTGPDGGLWIADMYRMVIEHPQWIPESWQTKLDLTAGHERGRIYRVHRKGRKIQSVPDLTKLNSTQLVSRLTSSNGWLRDTSQRLLIERADEASVPVLQELLRDNRRPLVQLHALWTLHAMERLGAQDVLAALESPHANVICAAVKCSGLDEIAAAGGDTAGLAAHNAIRVRYALALAAGDATDQELKTAVLSRLAGRDLQDPWMRAAIISSSVGCAERLLTTVLAEVDESDGRSELVSALIATSLANSPTGGALRLLTEIAHPKAAKEKVVASWQLSACADVLDALAARRLTLEQLSHATGDGAESDIQQFLTRLFSTARRLAADEKARSEDRIIAVRLLGCSGPIQRQGDESHLAPLLSSRVTPELQSAVIQALAAMGRHEVLLARIAKLTPSAQRQVFATLLATKPGVTRLLDSLTNDDMAVGDLDAATRNALLTYPASHVRERAEKLLAATVTDRTQAIKKFTASLNLSGDVAAGRSLFTKACAACHRHHDIGQELGPKLALLQEKSPEFLLTSILDPNRAVESKYRSYSIVTDQGVVKTGMIVDESATSITLAQADGKRVTVLRRNIDELTIGRSFMPEGVEKGFTQQNMADLLAFLRTTSR